MKQKVNARYIAVDIHKSYMMVGGVNGDKEMVMRPRRVSLSQWDEWVGKHIQQTDAVVIEATTNVWHIYDQLVQVAGQVVVAHAGKTKLIAAARVKTDRLDVLNLARLLAADLIPEVWVPPMDVRELRGLTAHRLKLVSARTRLQNQLLSSLHRHNIVPPTRGKALFDGSLDEWWAELSLPACERLRQRHDLARLRLTQQQLAEVNAELNRMSTQARWQKEMRLLIQVPGIGVILGMTILGAMGTIERFPAAKQLVGYAGLGAGAHHSGQTHRDGRITKAGRRELRWAMVEVAHHAVKASPHWRAQFDHLRQRKSKAKAYVAIARKLLVAIWHILSKQESEIHADEHQIAYKMLTWSWAIGTECHPLLTRPQFVRYQLMQLGLGAGMTHIHHKSTRRRLASVAEVEAVLAG